MGVKEMLLEWTRFRVNCIKRSLAFDIDKKKRTASPAFGSEKILLDIDRHLDLYVKLSMNGVISNLMTAFALTTHNRVYCGN
jgi:DNA gyrase subunit A